MKTDCIKLQVKKWTVEVEGVSDAKGFAQLCCSDSKESNPAFEAIKSSKSTRIYRFEWNGQAYFYKEYLFSNLWKHRKILVRGKHLKRIVDLMGAAGLETPHVVCHARWNFRVFVVSEEAMADESVYTVMMAQSKTPIPNLQRFRFLFGKAVGQLHTAGFVHGDLRWGNVLVRDADTEHPVFIYIDNDRTRKFRRIPSRLRLMNLVQIKYPGSLLEKPELDWDSVWEGYMAGNPQVRADADRWRRRVDRKNARRVAAWWKKPRNRHLLEEKRAREAETR